MFTYSAYGLGIHSEIILPEFVPAEVGADVLIHLSPNDRIPDESREKPYYLRLGYEESIITIEALGTFLVLGGHEITLIPARNVDLHLIQGYITGMIMSILLYQRGFLVLHASAIHVNGNVIAFLGAQGSGKSSLAAAFHLKSYDFVTDDVTAVEIKNHSAIVFPGFPQIKLSVESANALGTEIATLIPLNELEDKREYGLNGGFLKDPLPLNRIYVLTKDTINKIERLTTRDAVIELVRHSLPTRWAQNDNKEHFLKCIQLANQIQVYNLKQSFSLPTPLEQACLIEEHILHSH